MKPEGTVIDINPETWKMHEYAPDMARLLARVNLRIMNAELSDARGLLRTVDQLLDLKADIQTLLDRIGGRP